MISKSKINCFILCIIPLCIFFAIEGGFSIQSIIFPIIMIFMCSLVFNYSRKEIRNCIIGVMLIVFSIIVSFFYNVFKYSYLITDIYLIRILYTFIILAFYYSMSKSKITINQVIKVFNSIIIVGTVLSLYFMLIKPIWYHNFWGVKIDKNYTGAFLSLSSLIAFYICFYSNKVKKKLIYATLLIVNILGIFLSASRASMLISIVGILFIILQDLIQNKKGKHIFILLFLSLIIMILIFPHIKEYIMASPKYSWYWNRYFVNSYQDKSNTTRLTLWKQGLKMWARRPVFGYGPGSISLYFSVVAHNTFIDYMVDTGIIGLFGFLFIWFDAVKDIVISKKSNLKFIPLITFFIVFILPAERSVFLWFSLILCRVLVNSGVYNSRRLGPEYK